MKEELKTAIKRLENLPPDRQTEYGNKINQHFNELEDLRESIAESLASGEPIPFDPEHIKAEGRRRLTARENALSSINPEYTIKVMSHELHHH